LRITQSRLNLAALLLFSTASAAGVSTVLGAVV
jgi:hypothetical protein